MIIVRIFLTFPRDSTYYIIKSSFKQNYLNKTYEMSEADNSDPDLLFLPTNGGTALILGTHKYHVLKKYKNGASIWRCSNYKKEKCLGTVTIKVCYLHVKPTPVQINKK